MDKSESSAIGIVVFAAVLLGFLGVCNRYLISFGLHPVDVSFVRSFITVIILLAFLAIKYPDRLRVRLNDLWIFVLFGVFKFLSDFTLFSAQNTIPLSLASLLQLTSPYYVLVLSLLLFHEKITFKKVFCMILAFFGLMLVCDVFTGGKNVQTQGVMCAIASGFCYGVYVLGGKIVTDRKYTPDTSLLYMFLFACICSVPLTDFGAVGRAFTDPTALCYCLVLGILLTLVPFFIYIWGATKIPVSTVAILGVIEAVSASVVGFFFFQESITPINLLGMTIVLGSIVLLNIQITKQIRIKRAENNGKFGKP